MSVGTVDAVDESMVDAFQADGAVLVPQLFDAGWIEELRAAADSIVEHSYAPATKLGESTTSQSVASDGMWRWCEPFVRFLVQSPISATAAAVLRSHEVRLFEDLFLYTEAGADGAIWHRDAPHWPIRGQQLCSVWFSLEPVALDEGALHFVAGSHADGESVGQEGLAPELDAVRRDRRIFGFATQPGDAVVFHPRIVHAALGSRPERPRRTFTIRFTGDDVRWRPRRAYYHQWMSHSGLAKGDPLAHPWFPVVGSDEPTAVVS